MGKEDKKRKSKSSKKAKSSGKVCNESADFLSKKIKKMARDLLKNREELFTERRQLAASKYAKWQEDPRKLLRVESDFDINAFPRQATPGWRGGEKLAEIYLNAHQEQLSDRQEHLFAAAKSGANDAILLVLQGLDTAGKGGIVRHVMGLVDPQGILLSAFKTPNDEERQHDFLWRIKPRLPKPGYIGVFDRSHYEDLLVPTAEARTGMKDDRGNSWVVSVTELNRRYHDIYQMELDAVSAGMRIIKVCLLVSYEEQGRRLLARVNRPDKHWKFSAADLETRTHWDDFQSAYQEILRRTSTEIAPWYVIPADHKWYARLAVAEILLRTLADINPQWPTANFDIAQAKAALMSTLPLKYLTQSGD